MNRKQDSLMEEINDDMITDDKPDKYIYRTKLFEILRRHLGLR